MERSEQKVHVVGDEDNGVDDIVDNSDDSANKHFAHLKKLDDFCLTERSMQNNCVDDDNGDGVDNSDDGVNKHLTHLSQAVGCCLTERSDPNGHVNDGKEGVDNNDDDSVD
eukprot:13272803-Ditylum_brightwellii.AAC.1